mmetsp:Transcript_45487/g.99053  ORF Transcript_45487/g.99053 Transcript_45487/m.99053 type:complete len:312 (+) Transcript_45487:597-1532(+)
MPRPCVKVMDLQRHCQSLVAQGMPAAFIAFTLQGQTHGHHESPHGEVVQAVLVCRIRLQIARRLSGSLTVKRCRHGGVGAAAQLLLQLVGAIHQQPALHLAAGSGDAQFLILHRVVHQKSKILDVCHEPVLRSRGDPQLAAALLAAAGIELLSVLVSEGVDHDIIGIDLSPSHAVHILTLVVGEASPRATAGGIVGLIGARGCTAVRKICNPLEGIVTVGILGAATLRIRWLLQRHPGAHCGRPVHQVAVPPDQLPHDDVGGNQKHHAVLQQPKSRVPNSDGLRGIVNKDIIAVVAKNRSAAHDAISKVPR